MFCINIVFNFRNKLTVGKSDASLYEITNQLCKTFSNKLNAQIN